MKKLFFLLLSALCIGLSACSDDETVAVDTDQDDDNTTASIDETYIYKLPVIFHVLYKDKNDATQYVSAARIKEILDNVNELYRGNVYGKDVDGSSENIMVQFELANYDENGHKLATPGVEYVEWSGSYPINYMNFMSDNSKSNVKYIWEPNEYINVMLYNFTSDSSVSGTETLGISHLPYTLEGYNEMGGLDTLAASYSGISKRNLSFAYCSSINSKYINYESDRYTNASHKMLEKSLTSDQIMCDINVTLAHELGHYLGLLHAFSEKETSDGSETIDLCYDSDYCDDTPTYNRKEYLRDVQEYMQSLGDGDDVSFRRVTQRSNCNGDDFYSTNLMDYSYSYAFEFTKQQKKRMRQVLYNSPLIPGPKKRLKNASTAAAKTRTVEGTVDLPIRLAK